MNQVDPNIFARKLSTTTRAKLLAALTYVASAIPLIGIGLSAFLANAFSLPALVSALVATPCLFLNLKALLARLESDDPSTSTPSAFEHRLGLGAWIGVIFVLAFGPGHDLIALASVLSIVVFWSARQVSGIPLNSFGESPSGRRFQETKGVDSIASLLVAVAVIVTSYGFGLRVFQIPTGSMEPTLLGEPITGERAIIDQTSTPEVGDITVFRFPMARGQDYVKRMIAEGGEQILILQGDIYKRGADDAYPKMWRKEGRLRKALWLNLLDFDGGQQAYTRQFAGLRGKSSVEGDQIELTPDPEKKRGSFRYPREGHLRDHDPSRNVDPDRAALHNTDAVSDARIRSEIQLESGATFTFEIISKQQTIRFECSDGEAPIVRLLRADKEILKVEHASTLESGRSYELEAGVADGEIFLTIDGVSLEERSLFESAYESQFAALAQEDGALEAHLERLGGDWLLRDSAARNEFNTFGAHLEFHSSGAAVAIKGLKIDRDIHYLGRRLHLFEKDTVKIDEGQSLPYLHRVSEGGAFMLGDHSQDSLDSRSWFQVTLTIEGELRRFPIDAFFPQKGASPERVALRYDTLNALQRLIPDDEVASKLAAFEEGITGGLLGLNFSLTDIFGIERDFKVTDIDAVEIKAIPDVGEGLMVGKLIASVFPNPRFIE